MMNIQWKLLVGIVTIVAVHASYSNGGTIATSPAPVASGPGLGLAQVPLIATVNPSNDNQSGGGAADNNLEINAKRFDFGGYIDLVFSVAASDLVTEYKVTEFVDNNTGVPWNTYTMQLGFGTGAGFQLATAASGLDFDAPGYDSPPTSAVMPSVTLSPAELVFSGAIQGSGAQLYTFRIDVPNIPGTAGPGTFTLRQFGTEVPEPSTALLLGFASIAGAAVFRRRN
jgi:PEP-CTERM motif